MAVSAQITSSLRQRARFIGLAAGFLAGVLNAIVARLLMRVIALVAFGHGSFSVSGTAVIFMFGTLVGPLLGLIYVATLYRLRAHAMVKGLLFGLALLITLQAPGLLAAPEFAAELMAVGPLGFGVFAAMNFAFVLTLAGLTAWLEKWWSPANTRREVETSLTAAFGLLALGGLVLLVVEIGGRLVGLVK